MDIVQDKKNILNVVKRGECSGCMACINTCPIQAISIQQGKDSFLYPNVDMNKCVNCGVCEKNCPRNKTLNTINNSYCYAIQASDEYRMVSSSGGIFSLVAEWILSQGGLVCGAAYGPDGVKHICIEKKSDLYKLQKSKYIQSDCSGIYSILKKELPKRKVLFSGTPCQCAGIKSIFPDDVNLYLIDILCMGVPSQELFNQYIREDLNNASIENIDFRNKEINGWEPQLYLSIDTKTERKYIKSEDSSFFDSFLRAYSIRESCTTCHFSGKERIGDITIGDFWGIEYVKEEIDDKKGTSLLLINSNKGRDIIDRVKKRFICSEKFDISIAKKLNPIICYPTIVSSKRREFVDELTTLSIKDRDELLKNNKADCGIINYWWCNDNGAILTAYALQTVLKINGITSRLINISTENTKRRNGISYNFEKRYLYSTDPIISETDFRKLNNSFKTFIVGSDQVFRAEWVDNKWFLNFVKIKKTKIAMAASFGIDELNVNSKRKKEIEYLLSRFNNISIREKSGVELCEKMGIHADYVIDPVFILEPEYYDSVIEKSEEKIDKPYIFAYFRDNSKKKEKLLLSLSERFDIPCYIANDDTPVDVFLKRIECSNCVVTDSYHGLCFSLIFNKKFVCYSNSLRGNTRFDTLKEYLKFDNDRIVDESNETDMEKVISLLTHDDDWDKINLLIKERREEGLQWILNAIKEPQKIKKILLIKKYVSGKLFKDFKKFIKGIVLNKYSKNMIKKIKNKLNTIWVSPEKKF